MSSMLPRVQVFFGGVTALHPPDFKRANGFPNSYWGWGMEVCAQPPVESPKGQAWLPFAVPAARSAAH